MRDLRTVARLRGLRADEFPFWAYLQKRKEIIGLLPRKHGVIPYAEPVAAVDKVNCFRDLEFQNTSLTYVAVHNA